MKKLFLLLALCCTFTSCTAVLVGTAIESISLTKFSFQADGAKVKATDDNVGTLRIIETEGHGFAIAYRGSRWDVNNSYTALELGLNCGFFTGSLQVDQEYVFTLDDNLAAYPMFTYDEGGSFWFNATDGWFKITKISEKNGTISGRFAFTAVCDDPASGKVVEITDGVFKNIPYIVVKD